MISFALHDAEVWMQRLAALACRICSLCMLFIKLPHLSNFTFLLIFLCLFLTFPPLLPHVLPHDAALVLQLCEEGPGFLINLWHALVKITLNTLHFYYRNKFLKLSWVKLDIYLELDREEKQATATLLF